MRVGVFIGETTGEQTSVDRLAANARDAESRGLATGWVPHIPWSLDALTALAIAARETSTIELGTAVVPTFPRHPLSLAQDALSVQAVAAGRLALGIGPSHPVVVEGMYGLSYDAPAAHTEEYVEVLRACFTASGRVDWDGARFRVHAPLDVPGATAIPVLVAALAPRMLELTGRLADGTITYWADERAIAEHVVPRITTAASAAGRFRLAPASTVSSAPLARRANVSLPPAVASANPSRRTTANHTLASRSGAPMSAKRPASGAMSESVSLTSNTMTRGRGCMPAPLRGSGGPAVLRTRSRRAGGRRPGSSPPRR